MIGSLCEALCPSGLFTRVEPIHSSMGTGTLLFRLECNVVKLVVMYVCTSNNGLVIVQHVAISTGIRRTTCSDKYW